MFEGVVVVELLVQLLVGVEIGEIEAAQFVGQLGTEAGVGGV